MDTPFSRVGNYEKVATEGNNQHFAAHASKAIATRILCEFPQIPAFNDDCLRHHSFADQFWLGSEQYIVYNR
jgi:hypothetical protein